MHMENNRESSVKFLRSINLHSYFGPTDLRTCILRISTTQEPIEDVIVPLNSWQLVSNTGLFQQIWTKEIIHASPLVCCLRAIAPLIDVYQMENISIKHSSLRVNWCFTDIAVSDLVDNVSWLWHLWKKKHKWKFYTYMCQCQLLRFCHWKQNGFWRIYPAVKRNPKGY